MSTQYNGYAWPAYEPPPPVFAAAPYQTGAWNTYAPPAAMQPYQDDVFSEVLSEMTAQDPGFAAQFNLLPAVQPPMHPAAPFEGMPPRQEMPNVLREALENWENRKYESSPADITDKQMKALGRTHLILMLHDTQAELDQISRDYEALLTGLYAALVLQAGGGP